MLGILYILFAHDEMSDVMFTESLATFYFFCFFCVVGPEVVQVSQTITKIFFSPFLVE